MPSIGEIRSGDGLWLAVIHDLPDGRFVFRVYRLDQQTRRWVEVPDQPARTFATEQEAIAQVGTDCPALSGQPYQPPSADAPAETAEELRARGRQALFGAIALAIGIAFLVYHHLWPGMVFLTLGCAGLGWSIGGYDGGGYGASNS